MLDAQDIVFILLKFSRNRYKPCVVSFYDDRRTWNYQLMEYEYILTYDQGGFDLCILNIPWDIEWNPGKWFTCSCYPYSQNFCQFTNASFDVAHSGYLYETKYIDIYNDIIRMQDILYEELPIITLFYPTNLFLVNSVDYFEPFSYTQIYNQVTVMTFR